MLSMLEEILMKNQLHSYKLSGSKAVYIFCANLVVPSVVCIFLVWVLYLISNSVSSISLDDGMLFMSIAKAAQIALFITVISTPFLIVVQLKATLKAWFEYREYSH